MIRDPGCLSRILIFIHPGCRIPDLGSRLSDPGSQIPDLGSRISDPGSRIPDPTTAPKEKGEKFVCLNIVCSHKYHKIVDSFIFGQVKRIFCQNTKNYSTFYPKICYLLSYQKYGFGIRDPRFGIRKSLFRIPDSGTKRHRTPDPDP